jgi:hypothetical protein
MARTKDTTFFEMKLLEFINSNDPLLEMLDWMTKQGHSSFSVGKSLS